MNAILTGIYSAYNASTALKAALPGGLHLDMAKTAPAGTYAVYSVISARPEYHFQTHKFEVLNIQFDIYATTNALRMTAYGALLAVFDDATPAATGYTAVIMQRTFQQLLKDGDQNQLFRAIVTYDCRYLKS